MSLVTLQIVADDLSDHPGITALRRHVAGPKPDPDPATILRNKRYSPFFECLGNALNRGFAQIFSALEADSCLRRNTRRLGLQDLSATPGRNILLSHILCAFP